MSTCPTNTPFKNFTFECCLQLWKNHPQKMGSKIEFRVLTETNLDTRIAVAVSPDITAGIFKRELEKAHICCFPELGFISIDAVMAKRNSYFYHLPDLLPLKHVFQGFQDTWLLHVNVRVPNNLPDTKNGTEVCQKTRRKRRKKKKPKVKKLPEFLPLEQQSLEPRTKFPSICEREINIQKEMPHLSKKSDSNAVAESPSESCVSVSGIINRYFKNFIDLDHIGSASNYEVQSTRCDVEKTSSSKRGSKKQKSERKRQRLLPSLLPEDSNTIALENKYERSEVGKRLVVASNNLGSSQRSAFSKGKMLQNSDDGSMVRRLIFEIDSND